MAREDILPQMLRTLMQKEGPPEESDNSVLQKMVVPQDTAYFVETITVTTKNATDMQWSNPNFVWGAAQWQQ